MGFAVGPVTSKSDGRLLGTLGAGSRIDGLSVHPDRLQELRLHRMKRMGGAGQADRYTDMAHILEEMAYADAVFKAHRRWPVLDVTGRSIEETAGLVLDRVFGKERVG